MKFTVTWKPRALQQLAEIWLAASNREAVSLAGAKIEEHLRHHAGDHTGQAFGAHLAIARPIVVAFDVREDDRVVEIIRIGYWP